MTAHSTGGALVLLMADGRFPGGGHAHSGGLEAAVADGSVDDVGSLRRFLLGRVVTTGPTEAWFAAEAHRRSAIGASDPAARQASLEALADHLEARTPSSAQRAASRALGRGLRRVAHGLWPDAERITVEPYPVVLGIAAQQAGLSDLDAARIAVHNLVTGPATAAPKLFAIDMVDAMRATIGLTPEIDAAAAVGLLDAPPPPRSAPLCELRAQAHAAWDVRLFAS